VAKAKIKADLVEAARAFMSSDGFKQEVINVIPAEVVYSFEAAMEEVLTSAEGLNTFKTQWTNAYRKYAKQWAKGELNRSWAMALEATVRFVERENESGNDGQNLFDQRYRTEFAAHEEQIKKIRRVGYDFDMLASKEVEGLNSLIAKLDAVKTVVKTNRHKKPNSCAARGKANKGVTKTGGGKKRGVKGRKTKGK
jgi:hypothetical protein